MKTCFCHLNVVWHTLAEERLAISTQSIHRWKVHLVGCNSVADNTGLYLYSSSCYCLRNTRNVAKFQENLTLQQFKVIDLGVNGKPICDFVLVINVTLAVSASVFQIFRFKDRKLLIFTHPFLVWRPRSGIPLEFLDETYTAKTRWMVLPYGENYIILTSTVFV